MNNNEKFLYLFHRFRALVVSKGKKPDYSKFNEYIASLPRERSLAMTSICKYRNELVYSRHFKPLPDNDKKLIEWIKILEEEIRN